MEGLGNEYYKRFVAECVTSGLLNAPVVLLRGPQGCGKTGLVQLFATEGRKIVNLKRDSIRADACYDPTGFVRGVDRVIIDEVQRVPDLLFAIKNSIDKDPRPGRFLLTSSSNFLALPQFPEGLSAWMEILTLFPISKAEIEGKRPSFLKEAFGGRIIAGDPSLIGVELIDAIVAGGYPEMLRRGNSRRRQAWARGYVKEVVEQYLQGRGGIEKAGLLRRLLQLLAVHSGELTNFAQIGEQLGIDDKTTRKYADVLEQWMLVQRVPAWFQSSLSRLVKTPKLHFLDSGLLAALLGLSVEKVARDRRAFATLLKTFVFSEILKQASWSDLAYTVSYYRDKDQDEVHFVVEGESDGLVGIDVKPGATVYAADFKGLKKLEKAAGDKLKLGVVLYDGDRIVPFGDRLFAAPVSCLWS